MSIEIANFTDGQRAHSDEFHKLADELKAKYPNMMLTIIHDEGFVEAFLHGSVTDHVKNPFFEICKATTNSLIIEHCRIMDIEVPSPHGPDWQPFLAHHLAGMFLALLEDYDKLTAELITALLTKAQH